MEKNIREILSLDTKTIKDLLSMDLKIVYKAQYDALKAHGLNVLKKIIHLLESEQYDLILPMLSHSTSGDDMGMDNNFIDFNFSKDGYDDISSLICELKHLKELSK